MLRPLSIAALLLPLHAYAATETVPLDISLTVKESCHVEQDGGSAPPAVTCALDSPYRIQAGGTERSHATRAAPKAIRHPAPAQWEVVF